tara:strand:- start:83 stop:1027 length:945 start_codon:yes stop_codon:yes gene_type:complete
MKPNKYQIFIARRIWFWFWRELMNGFAPSDKDGNYKRPKGIKVNNYSKININYNDNLFILIGSSCPWCHRILLLYKLMDLSEKIKIIHLQPNYKKGEWIFKNKFYENNNLDQLYKNSSFIKAFRSTLPVMIRYKGQKTELISNESGDIIKILNLIFNNQLKENNFISDCDDDLLNLINDDINDGVYKCGFARNQNSYIYSSKRLFSALKDIDTLIKTNGGPWILGKKISVADIYLFPTLIRWEMIYSKLFKCTEKEICKFKNIIQWRYRFFNLNGISETCFDKEWLEDYYKAIFPLNPNQIIPLQPSLYEIINP